MKFPSDEWLAAYKDRINASDSYKAAAETWEGDLTYVIEAEPDKGVPTDVHAWVDLWHGECRDAQIVDAERGMKSRFVIRGPYSRWKEIIRGELEPIKAIMQGKLKLTGDLPTIVKYMQAAKELVKTAAEMPTEFADEPGS